MALYIVDSFKHYTGAEIARLTNTRLGEVKIGEKISVLTSFEALVQSSAKFILVGIPEDVGVRANYGLAGAASAWVPVLKALLNLQSNAFLDGSSLAVLGHFDIKAPADNSIEGLREKVEAQDELIFPVLQKIFSAGKIPIVIGGGHNNAYPILKAYYRYSGQPCSTVNIDAHADIRPTNEGRHSGNAFSAALEQGFLAQYNIFGLHQSYNNQYMLDKISQSAGIIGVRFFEDILRSSLPVHQQFDEFTAGLPGPLGLEIDLDSIENILSSASTPSGFALNDVRKIILHSRKKFSYLHICEGAVVMEDGRTNMATAKAVAYLISDFVK